MSGLDPGTTALAERLARLAPEAWDPPAPPPLRVSVRAPAPRRRLTLRPAAALAAACALLGLGLLAGVLLNGRDDGPATATGHRLVLVPPSAAGAGAHGRGTLVAGGAHPHLIVRVGGLRPTRGGYYELWLMNSDRDLVSLGGFRVGAGGAARVDVPLPVSARRYKAVDISAEPADGNPAHSAVSVLRGPVS